jgi:hypothetical protein
MANRLAPGPGELSPSQLLESGLAYCTRPGRRYWKLTESGHQIVDMLDEAKNDAGDERLLCAVLLEEGEPN